MLNKMTKPTTSYVQDEAVISLHNIARIIINIHGIEFGISELNNKDRKFAFISKFVESK